VGHGFDQFVIDGWRKLLAVGLDVAGQVLMILGCLPIGATGLDRRPLFGSQLDIGKSPTATLVSLRRVWPTHGSFIALIKFLRDGNPWL
jgi:hypothetical protein